MKPDCLPLDIDDHFSYPLVLRGPPTQIVEDNSAAGKQGSGTTKDAPRRGLLLVGERGANTGCARRLSRAPEPQPRQRNNNHISPEPEGSN